MRVVATFILGLSLFLIVTGNGCGGPGPAAPEAANPAETPEQTAARLFTLARNLETEKKSKQAFAAYNAISRHYPETIHGKKAAQRIVEAQKAAMRKVAGQRAK